MNAHTTTHTRAPHNPRVPSHEQDMERVKLSMEYGEQSKEDDKLNAKRVKLNTEYGERRKKGDELDT